MLHQFKKDNPDQRKWRITVVGGTGAVGAYFSVLLSSAKHEVSIIGRPNSNNLYAVQENGLTLLTTHGEISVSKDYFNFIGEFDKFPREKMQDLVIICVKQYDLTEKIANQVLSITRDDSLVGVIGNGLPFYFLRGLSIGKEYLSSTDEAGCINGVLKNRKIVGIQPTIAAKVRSPSKVEISRPLHLVTVSFGSPENDLLGKINDLAEFFNNANIKSTLMKSELRKNILEKLQFSVSINTLSALMEESIDQVFDSPETQPLIEYSVALINQISIEIGVGILRDYEKFKAIVVTKGHFSSLHHDLKTGKPGEIKAILDTTIEIAELIMQQKNFSHILPDLQPLKELKNCLELKTTNHDINPSKLAELFQSCKQALDSFNQKQHHSTGLKNKI